MRNLQKPFQIVTILAAIYAVGVPFDARAEDALLIDLYQLPEDCTSDTKCARDGTPLMTSILRMGKDQASRFTQAIESTSVIRGLPQSSARHMCQRNLSPATLEIENASEPEVLADHPGVYFDSTSVDAIDEVAGFSDQVREVLQRVGLKLLSREEWLETPGRPTLSLNYSPGRENAGCIIPFYVSLVIKEEVLLARDLKLKINSTIWSKTVRQSLASLHFSPQSAISEALDTFERAFQKANRS